MVRGRQTCLLQSVGGLSAAAMTRWSSLGAERARCPKNLKRRDFTLSETGKHVVILRTVSMVVCWVYGIHIIFWRHQLSKALRRFPRVLVTVLVCIYRAGLGECRSCRTAPSDHIWDLQIFSSRGRSNPLRFRCITIPQPHFLCRGISANRATQNLHQNDLSNHNFSNSGSK